MDDGPRQNTVISFHSYFTTWTIPHTTKSWTIVSLTFQKPHVTRRQLSFFKVDFIPQSSFACYYLFHSNAKISIKIWYKVKILYTGVAGQCLSKTASFNLSLCGLGLSCFPYFFQSNRSPSSRTFHSHKNTSSQRSDQARKLASLQSRNDFSSAVELLRRFPCVSRITGGSGTQP